MEEFFSRIWENLVGRVQGPMRFRFILQPLTACLFAIRAGIIDARAGKSPFLWDFVFHAGHRRALLSEVWRDVGKVFVFSMLLDVLYQLLVLHTVYPGESVLVAFALAVIPYVLVRGPVTRLLSRRPRSP
jgi:hypothetical protein